MKVILLLMSCLCFGTTSFSQLDSTSMEITFVDSVYFEEDSSYYDGVMKLALIFDDIADLSLLNIVIYNNNDQSVIVEKSLEVGDLEENGIINNDRFEIYMLIADSGSSYRIEVNPQNVIRAYTKPCIAVVSYML